MITSPIRPPAPTGTGHRCHGPARPPETALRRFTLVRNHNAPTASSRHALTDTHQRQPSRQRATPSIRGRALASSVMDSPCQGSRTGLSPPVSTTCPAHPLRLRLRSGTAARPRISYQTKDRKPDGGWGHFKRPRRGQSKRPQRAVVVYPVGDDLLVQRPRSVPPRGRWTRLSL